VASVEFQVKKPAGDERKGEWKSLEIDGENVLRIFGVVSRKC
jgi:hypothetical protein